MTLTSNLSSGLRSGLLSGLNPLGVAILADLDFSVPVTQSFGSSNATHQYLLQETSGNYADTGTGTTADIDTFVTGFKGQVAPGIWDGSSYIATKAWETSATSSTARVSDSSVFDSDNTDLYFRMYFRVSKDPAFGKRIMSKRTATEAGWDIILQGVGRLDLTIEDGSGNFIVVQTTGDYTDGSLHFFEFFYDVSADELTVNTDLDGGNSAIDTSTVTGSLTTAANFTMGNAGGHEKFQFVMVEGAEGAAASTMFAETNFFTHGTDPTGLLTTQTRSSLISVPVSAVHVAHFCDDTLPIGFNPGFSDTDKLGVFCNTPVINLIANSEDFTAAAWVATNITKAGNDADSPDGFRSASKLTATAANGQVAHLFTTVAATQYTLSVYLKENTVTGRLVFFDETGAVELASQVFTGTADWDQRITVTATTNALQVSSSFRIEIDTDTEALNPWGVQAELGATAGAYIRTDGSTAALDASVYESTADIIPIQTGEIAATVVPLRDLVGVNKTICDSNASTTDQRFLYIDTSDQVAAELRGGAISETVTDTGVAITYGVERNIRLIWDVAGSSLGFETLLVDAGSTTDGDALPYEQTHGTGFTGIAIGATNAGISNFDGFIQRIQVFDGKNGATP